ncbi:hypothetical protein [Bifidobacterium breve]|uniref:hypothetical protein n=1 Tax=Bifidobacterium breve TaxID=1685 RepID=UPI0032DE6D66
MVKKSMGKHVHASMECDTEMLKIYRKAVGTAAMVSVSIPLVMTAPAAFADDNIPATDSVSTSVRSTRTALKTADQTSNDDLFAQYVDSVFSPSRISLFSSAADDQLKGKSKLLYDYLKEQIERIADGKTANTSIDIPLSVFGLKKQYNAADLGMKSLYDLSTGKMYPETEAKFEALREKKIFEQDEFNAVMDALLADCPYDLYWYDKKAGSPLFRRRMGFRFLRPEWRSRLRIPRRASNETIRRAGVPVQRRWIYDGHQEDRRGAACRENREGHRREIRGPERLRQDEGIPQGDRRPDGVQ